MRVPLTWSLGLFFLFLTSVATFAQAPVRVRNAAELQAALRSVRDGGVIELAAGTYRAPANGFSAGNLRRSFTVRAAAGVPAASVVLDGEGARQILQIENRALAPGKSITFQGLTFANGLSTGGGDAGGVSIAAAEVRFLNCVFRDNRAGGAVTEGGAARISNGSTVSFVGCELRGNSAQQRGGAISMRNSDLFVHSSVFADNRANLPGHAPGAAGGAIYVLDGNLRVSESRFERNQAGWVGGAIYIFGIWAEPIANPRAEAVVVLSTFTENLALADPCCAPPAEPTGGAIHAENQATLRIYQSFFQRNQAQFGGAIDLYRSVAEIEGSIFQANRAPATGSELGAGGAILALSNDEPVDTVNRRPVRLTLADSLLQGGLGATPAANGGGCLLIGGDTSRLYGQDGIAQAGTAAENRAVADIRNVLFADCDVDVNQTGEGGVGGALEGDLVDLSLEGSLILDSEARGTDTRGGMGGGIALQYESDARIARTALARNSARRQGGGLFLGGSVLRMVQSQLFGNDVQPGISERLPDSRGAALFTIPLLANGDPSRARDVAGEISSSVLSDNLGLAIWEVEPESGPVNDVRYNGNRIFTPIFGDLVYVHTLTDPGRRGSNVPELNNLVVGRPGRPATRKSEVPNERLFSPPSAGTVLAAPSNLTAGAPGAAGRSRLGYAWSGGSASLSGQPLGDHAGLQPVSGPGDFPLVVDGQAAGLTRVAAAQCTTGPVLCLQGGRFRAEVRWKDTATGARTPGRAAQISNAAGYFWLSDPGSADLAVRILPATGGFTVSVASLSTMEAAVTVFDTATGRSRVYANPAGSLVSLTDARSFPAASSAARATAPEEAGDLAAAPAPACAVGPGQLCLAGGRIRAEMTWRNPRTGRDQAATAVSLGGSSGYFWFTAAGAPEVVLKIVDGRAINRFFWVFYGAFSPEAYTLTVTDTETGRKKTYRNTAGKLQSVGDTAALRE